VTEERLRREISVQRRFRHIVHHSYVLQLRWSRMAEGVRDVDRVYARFKENLRKHMLID
jgi:hypothetical protein